MRIRVQKERFTIEIDSENRRIRLYTGTKAEMLHNDILHLQWKAQSL